MLDIRIRIRHYYSGYWASARLEVKPRDAQVYLDGYYVGVVDQFDGTFQRLDIPGGEHEIAIYMPGYHTLLEHTLFRPGQTYHFKDALRPLPQERRPKKTASDRTRRRRTRRRRPASSRPGRNRPAAAAAIRPAAAVPGSSGVRSSRRTPQQPPYPQQPPPPQPRMGRRLRTSTAESQR